MRESTLVCEELAGTPTNSSKDCALASDCALLAVLVTVPTPEPADAANRTVNCDAVLPAGSQVPEAKTTVPGAKEFTCVSMTCHSPVGRMTKVIAALVVPVWFVGACAAEK